MNYGYHFATSPAWKLNYQHRLIAGAYRQPYYQNGFFSNYTIALGYRFPAGVDLWSNLGLGFMYTFEDAAVYKQNDTGEFTQVRDYGRGSFFVPLGVEVAYNFSERHWIKALYMQYRLDVELTFLAFPPVLPHEYLALGFRF